MDQLRVICARIPGNELVSAECHNLTGGLPGPDGVAACIDLQAVPHSAYLSLGLRLIAEAANLNELIGQIGEKHLAYDRFRVDLLRLYPCIDLSERGSIIGVANAIEAAPDLHHPLHRFLIVASESCLWFGEMINRCEHTYQKHDAKPYRTTNSLPSRLARGLVNLVSPPARTILDPFCGTGSILLEARAIGATAFGMDRSPKMTGMSRRNLAHFGYQAQVKLGDALNCQQEADAIVTDLPYGRTQDIADDQLLEILKHLVNLAPQGIYLTDKDITPLLEGAGYREIEVLRVRKRQHMCRFVHRTKV